jgi:cytoskeleton protein RodZ
MSLNDESASHSRIHLREISGDAESPLESVGQDLRAARLRRGDEIATVSRALKIRKDHLEALEGDRLEDLPGKTYAIGFVRSYARHLGLDSAQFVERYKQDISGRADEQAREPAPIHQDERRLPQGWRIIAGVIVLLLSYGAWHMLAGRSEDSQAVPPAPVLVQPKPVAVAPKPPAPAPVQTATPSPAADTVPPANAQAASATPPPAAGLKTPATTSVLTGAQAAVPAVPSASGQVYGAQNKSARVILRARNATHIEVRGRDGMVYINRTLAPGDSYQLPNIVGLSLTTTNGGGVELDLDGIAMGTAGGDLQPVDSVRLDPQSIVDRFNTRH